MFGSQVRAVQILYRQFGSTTREEPSVGVNSAPLAPGTRSGAVQLTDSSAFVYLLSMSEEIN